MISYRGSFFNAVASLPARWDSWPSSPPSGSPCCRPSGRDWRTPGWSTARRSKMAPRATEWAWLRWLRQSPSSALQCKCTSTSLLHFINAKCSHHFTSSSSSSTSREKLAALAWALSVWHSDGLRRLYRRAPHSPYRVQSRTSCWNVFGKSRNLHEMWLHRLSQSPTPRPPPPPFERPSNRRCQSETWSRWRCPPCYPAAAAATRMRTLNAHSLPLVPPSLLVRVRPSIGLFIHKERRAKC